MSRKGFANTHRFREWQKRHGERIAAEGRRLEDDVERVLAAMKSRGKIPGFARHEPHSSEDQQGCDFTVSKLCEDGGLVMQSFGVTISPRSWRRAKRTHPDIPQLCFPLGTNTETIERRILELFLRSGHNIRAAP